MQNDPRFFAGEGGHGYSHGGEEYYNNHNVSMGGFCGYGNPATPFFDGAPPPDNGGVLEGFELQASRNCPEKYVIFDQTDNRSRIMYNPAFGHHFNYPTSQQAYPDRACEGYRNRYNDVCNPSSSSSFKEDSDEIDVLLSLENDEEDEEDDVLSTGRTPCNDDGRSCNSPDSICSTGGSRSSKSKSWAAAAAAAAAHDTAASASTSKETKKERMRKMVKTLRGIVPGAKQMDTPAFLDEAVRYLKSLKVEARKLGIKN